jgi:hypothetical protein
MGLIRAIEFRAILCRIEVGADAEVTLLDGLRLHREVLRSPSAPLGVPLGEKQERKFEPGRVKR